MKKQFLKIAGVKTEQEFYDKYPNEEAFFKAHPNALKQLAGGGEAYPQTSTMDNFFSYGVPVPPTYYAHGGAYPMAQSEEQFFSPFYGNVPNPYNKAMGGSSESYRQAMSFPYGATGRSTHFMMADGGYTADEQQLPKMGVDGKITNLATIFKNTATDKLNANLREHGKVKNPEQYLFEARYGGNLRSYQSKKESAQTDPLLDRIAKGTRGDSPIFKPLDLPQIDANSDIGTTGTASQPAANTPYNPYNPYYGPQGTGMQLPPEYYNDIDYMYRGRMRPRSDFDIKGSGIFGKYRSTGWLEDEYGLDRLRQMGLTDIKYDKPKWYQLLKRPTKTYHFGPQGQQPQQEFEPLPSNQRDDGKQVFTRDPNDPNYKIDAITGKKVLDPVKFYTENKYTGDDARPDDKAQFKHDNPHLGDMGFFGRRFKKSGDITTPNANAIAPQLGTMTRVTPDQQVEGPDMVSQRSSQMWNRDLTPRRNIRVQKRLGNIDRRLDNLELFDAWQDAQTGEDGDLSGIMGREMNRLRRRRDRLENRMGGKEFGGELNSYQSKKTTGTVKTRKGQELPLNDHRFNEKTTFKPSMTVEEYLRSREMPEGLKQQIIDSNDPNIQWTPVQGVVDRKQVGNQPVGATTIIPLVVPPSSNNSKPSFYAPGADMFDGVEYITPDSVNFDSTNTDHRAAMMRAILSGATDDSYDELLPSMKKKKYGGSHSVGDVVDMTPEELQKFIEMGGQVEFLD